MQTTGLLFMGNLSIMATQLHAAETINKIRIQPLTEGLVRIEQKSDGGFENRTTFTVVNRPVETIKYTVAETNQRVKITTANYRISVPTDAESTDGIRIETKTGNLLQHLTHEVPLRMRYPSPSLLPPVWIMTDTPRIVPPEWGALPPPEGCLDPQSGWDLTNGSVDLYVFFPKATGYSSFREDFLSLTGRIPLPPLYTFGLWYSRYHPYSEKDALKVIDTFRAKDIPLDVFVADTDWREGASSGYGVNTELFPDMPRFLNEAHNRKVRVMYNDHPEPKGKYALAPDELAYRQKGLVSLLEMGADAWWFDRNWHTHLQVPTEGLNKEVWGMMLYHDITLGYRPNERPLIMSNVDGINNGHVEHPTHPAAHRYPIWWTGDTLGQWDYLLRGVENGVNSGINGMLPYVNEDLGGHIGHISAEYFLRFVQFGCFSPVTRLHCTRDHSRYPWQYGKKAEETAGDYFRLRYRLLPMIYTTAFQAWRDGTPLMRRCDLEWPQYSVASDHSQYLFGDDFLVAPIVKPATKTNISKRSVWIPEGEWMDAWSGEVFCGPKTIITSATTEMIPLYIRQGAIVATAPQTYTTEDFSWSSIVLDIYLPTTDIETTRELYEDDGHSNEYTNNVYGLTTLSLQKQRDHAVLRITPSETHNAFTIAQRCWTIRVHLPLHKKIAVADLDGVSLKSEEIKLIRPAARQTPQELFAGTNSHPPAHGGLVAEFQVCRKTDQPMAINIRW